MFHESTSVHRRLRSGPPVSFVKRDLIGTLSHDFRTELVSRGYITAALLVASLRPIVNAVAAYYAQIVNVE